ncbi:MAG TPA: D-arabinono-1,4-lactone oxidase [Mycobacteriales bacterium]|nr:D-arabinono-1,4-lactone oxidase [Mycobacteriales bacterium]
MAAQWRNWTGDQVSRPVRTLSPASTDEVVAAVGDAARDGLTVRMAGSGHSFTGAAVTDGVLLRPERLTGVVAIAGDTVTVRAGTRLHALSGLLAQHGLALENLGDIDVQTVAGAVATGTHGTGLGFGGLATQVAGLELVTASGEVVSPDPAAVTVGLGAYGIVTAVTLRCVPAFGLRAVESAERLDDLLARWDTLPAEADHVEFYWWPHTRDAQLKRNTRVPVSDLAPLPRWKAVLDDELVSNVLFGAVCRAGARVPALVPPANRLATRLLGTRTYADLSHRVFAHPRRVRFRETEWAVPRPLLPAILAELDATIRRRGWRVSFPVEVRVAAADDRWLSTAYGRETAYLAAHRYVREPHEDYLGAVADVVHAVAGTDARPHWGKLHDLTAAELAPRYPRFADALALRAELDPEGRFANRYTDRVLGPVSN